MSKLNAGPRPFHKRAGFLACALLCLAFGEASVAAEPPPKPLEPPPLQGPLPIRPTHGEPAAPEKFANPEMLVSTADLAQWMAKEKPANTPKFVVIDTRPRDEFTASRIPGAFNIESDFFQEPEKKPSYMATPETVAKAAVLASIEPDTRVILYDSHGGRLAARVWFTLWAYGHDHVSILDGGFPKWRDEARAAENGAAPAGGKEREGLWKPADKLRGLALYDDLARFRLKPPAPGTIPPTLMLDARSYAEYTGTDARAKLPGHFPGAVNMAWEAPLRKVNAKTKGIDDYLVWRQPPEIHTILRAAGLAPGQVLLIYDQSGGRSAHLMFSLLLLGYDKSLNYYGGWREYGNRDDVDVEK